MPVPSADHATPFHFAMRAAETGPPGAVPFRDAVRCEVADRREISSDEELGATAVVPHEHVVDARGRRQLHGQPGPTHAIPLRERVSADAAGGIEVTPDI